MILFVQTNGTKTHRAFGADFTEGRIMYADRISGNGDVKSYSKIPVASYPNGVVSHL